MSTINVNYMTQTYGNFMGKYNTRNKAVKSMSENLSEKIQKKAAASETSTVGEAKNVSAKEMSMEEYKAYIADKISQIPMHSTRMKESISITISEAGFEAMKNDPEYEAWVLNDLRVGWAQPDRWSGICGGAFSTIYYGATKEECHAQMWSAGYQDGNGKKIYEYTSQNSFWERKAENKKRIEEQMKKRQDKKQLQKAVEDRAAYEEYVQHKLLMEWKML